MRRLPSLEARPIPAPSSRTFQNGLVGQRSEGGCEQGPRAFQNTGIAVIQTAVQNHSRPAPGLPVGRAHELHLTKRANMIFTPSRPSQQSLLVESATGWATHDNDLGVTDGELVHPNDRRRRPQPKGRHGRWHAGQVPATLPHAERKRRRDRGRLLDGCIPSMLPQPATASRRKLMQLQ